jgi:hypothetical protein
VKELVEQSRQLSGPLRKTKKSEIESRMLGVRTLEFRPAEQESYRERKEGERRVRGGRPKPGAISAPSSTTPEE